MTLLVGVLDTPGTCGRPNDRSDSLSCWERNFCVCWERNFCVCYKSIPASKQR